VRRILAATRDLPSISTDFVSNTGASLILMAFLIALAIYFLVEPPPGFEGFVHRLAIPVVLVVGAHTIFESLRMRAHIAELVGALRGIMARARAPAPPEVRREAVEILLKSLRSDNGSVRKTALTQLRQLTGEDLGDDPGAWDAWWARNRDTFGSTPPGRA